MKTKFWWIALWLASVALVVGVAAPALVSSGSDIGVISGIALVVVAIYVTGFEIIPRLLADGGV